MGVFKIDPSSWNNIKKKLFKDKKNLNKIDITALFQLIIREKFATYMLRIIKKMVRNRQ